MRRQTVAIFALALLTLSCARSRGPERVPTIPVTGTVLLDGKPASEVTVTLHRQDTPPGELGVYTAHPTGLTDENGKFSLSTYEQGDGIAAGVYVATFQKLKYDAFRNRRGGPDQLKGKYSDEDKSEFKVSVTGEEEAPLNLGSFELSSKS